MKFVGVLMLLFLLAGTGNKTDVHASKKEANPEAIKVEEGYKIEAVVNNLSVPTTAIFDGSNLLIAESGWKDTAKPRILKVSLTDGKVETLAQEGLEGPVTGLLLVDDKLYVSHKGRVSIVEGGKLRDIVTGLPSNGDHQNNNLVLGKDGKIYMGQGTKTNSGVVGPDNFLFGWLDKYPQEYEVPCKDITLRGVNFETENILTRDIKDDKVITGAYKPYGISSQVGEIIKGNNKCGGSIVRFNPDGSNFELVAWGLRNPYGLEIDKDGQLWATYHGADVRGSRNIYNDPDYLVKVEQGAWYGWPEFFDGKPVTESRFKDPTKPQPEFLWRDHPQLTLPYLTFDSHSAANGIAISNGGKFGYGGEMFVAMFGSYSVATAGTDIRLPGYKIVKINLQTKEVKDFAYNKLFGPAYINKQGGLDHLSNVVFGPDDALYVVDWGATAVVEQGIKYEPGTGVVWRIYNANSQSALNKITSVEPAPISENEQKAELRNVPELYKALSGPVLAILAPIVIIIILLFLFIKILRNKR